MDLIQNNPFRVIGVLGNVSAKDLASRNSKIQAFARVGKEISSEFDFPFFSTVERSSSSIEKAFSDIEQNENKVKYSLFWFVNITSIDNTSIQYLINDNKDKAIEIWEKLIEDREINSKNFSALANLGTLYLLSNDKEELKKGVACKVKLIESVSFTDFVQNVADETFSIDSKKEVQVFADTLIDNLKSKYHTVELIQLFDYCNGETKEYISKKFTEEPIHKIERLVEYTKSKRTKSKRNAFRLGASLYKDVKNDLVLLINLLGNSDLKYKMISDKVAKELLQCSIDYFNESDQQELETDYLSEAMKLAKIAKSIAVNKITIDRINDNISTLEGMKEREVNNAIEILKMIKKAYEKACLDIDLEVIRMEAKMSYNQSINYSKIMELKRNALDWNKVIQLVTESISINDVDKIKKSVNHIKITEYKTLVDFFLEKLNNSQKSQVRYLCFWKKINTTEFINIPKNTFRPTTTGSSKSWSEENPGCIIALIIGGIILLISIFSFKSKTNDSVDSGSGNYLEYKTYPENNSSILEEENLGESRENNEGQIEYHEDENDNNNLEETNEDEY
ncbi:MULTISPECIES: tetratricopeptide repeat protein [unclassified Empedobacter]|uniref:tetratricopeptide repeat protein n=1 Tax=unclassified Empedobacter TaxID=2643773 RepID=UPI0025C571D2|nr:MULTISPECIES: hypothetical protein [unclassified Empedobacter]